jgi:carboxymethylenebutenolidase
MRFAKNSVRGAAAYAVLALLAALLGVAAMWMNAERRMKAARIQAAGPVTNHGEWVKIKRGKNTIRAYVAYPERKTKAPAVIVIHEIFGLTDWEPTVADRLAKEGFVAIVPDLLSSKHRKSPKNQDEGRKLIGELDPDSLTADLNATYAYVNSLPAVVKDHIGTIGFCWGGGQSFRYATNNPNLKAVVVAYGPPPDSAAIKRIKAPVLGVYGENDERIDATLPDVASKMEGAGKTFTYEVYPGTGHGFLKPGRQGSDGPQVQKAWDRILEFYRARLGK